MKVKNNNFPLNRNISIVLYFLDNQKYIYSLSDYSQIQVTEHATYGVQFDFDE